VFDDATFARTAAAFENDDYVEIVIHSYRHRLGLAPGDPAYEEIEHELAMLPSISVPAITLDPLADAHFPAGDGTAVARHFTGTRTHRHVANAGHNLPQEQPAAFAEAVLELAAT
jgi:pimeloyl-ACP methyl ester carboxylesterase